MPVSWYYLTLAERRKKRFGKITLTYMQTHSYHCYLTLCTLTHSTVYSFTSPFLKSNALSLHQASTLSQPSILNFFRQVSPTNSQFPISLVVSCCYLPFHTPSFHPFPHQIPSFLSKSQKLSLTKTKRTLGPLFSLTKKREKM